MCFFCCFFTFSMFIQLRCGVSFHFLFSSVILYFLCLTHLFLSLYFLPFSFVFIFLSRHVLFPLHGNLFGLSFFLSYFVCVCVLGTKMLRVRKGRVCVYFLSSLSLLVSLSLCLSLCCYCCCCRLLNVPFLLIISFHRSSVYYFKVF